MRSFPFTVRLPGERIAVPWRTWAVWFWRRQWAAVLAGAAVEVVLILPFGLVASTQVLDLLAAVGVAVGVAIAILVGPWEGALVGLVGAAVFVGFVSESRPGGYAALAAWPGLTLGMGLVVERALRQRARLERQLYRANQRLRALLEAGIALNSELALEGVLQELVEAAAKLTGARYAALGLVDRESKGLESFLFAGIDEATTARIGDLPRGRGVLGALLRETRPLRLPDVSAHPSSVGFPPEHPPMRSFLGVPILLRGVAYGNLYLTEKEDGAEFTAEDEELVSLLAGQAAVAIENARLYEAATRWLRQLEFLNEVSTALVSELELPRLLSLVARRLRELVGARLVIIALPLPDASLEIAAVDGDEVGDIAGLRLEASGSKAGRVLERRQSERVDSLLDDPEVDQQAVRLVGGTSGLYVPLLVGERAIGVIACHDKLGSTSAFSDADLRLVEAFATRAAVAVDLSERVARGTLRSMLEAQEGERRRLARELHDETAQALTSILLGLKAVEDRVGQETLRPVRDLVVHTLHDVRRLAVELRPKVLDDYGLAPALERLAAELAERTGIVVDLRCDLSHGERLPHELETAIYRIAQEALMNVVKHARAHRVEIAIRRDGRSVTAVVEDDGRGFSPADVDPDRLGIAGMRERVALVGGRLTVDSTPGSGTRLAVELRLP